MRTVNIGELKRNLSGYLRYVKNGEEIVVRDRNCPVARILPLRQDSVWERESQLIATGALKLPEEAMDWDRFFLAPSGNVSKKLAVEAARESHGDR
jgi:prevent-host-death family protein